MNYERMTRGMSSDAWCPLCQVQEESITHSLRECDEIKSLWSQFISYDHWSRFFSLGLDDWILWNLSSDGIGNTQFD